MNILLAEDDLNIVRIARTILEKVGGHQVDTARDGGEALEKALIGDYHLIILDGMMPVYPGIEVCRLYKRKQRGNKARIIFLTAKSSQKDINEFLTMGHGYIQKPFEPDNLCHLIDNIMEGVA